MHGSNRCNQSPQGAMDNQRHDERQKSDHSATLSILIAISSPVVAGACIWTHCSPSVIRLTPRCPILLALLCFPLPHPRLWKCYSLTLRAVVAICCYATFRCFWREKIEVLHPGLPPLVRNCSNIVRASKSGSLISFSSSL